MRSVRKKSYYLKSLPITMLFICTLLSSPSEASSYKPLTKIKIINPQSISFMNEGLIDPNVKVLSNSQDVEYAKDKINSFQRELKKPNKNRINYIYSQLMELHTSISYYYLKSENYNRSAFNRYAAKAKYYATLYSKKVKKNSAVFARNSYHINVDRYILKSGQATAIANLKVLQNSNKLSPRLKRRAAYLTYIWDINHGKRSSTNKLASLISSLPAKAAVAARLIVARDMAGLNNKGRKSRSPDKKYRLFLKTATQKSYSFNKKEKQEVLTYALSIWRNAEGRKASWFNAPIHFASLREFPELNALKEREALDLWNKKQERKAISTLLSLSGQVKQNKLKHDLEIRIISMEKTLLNKSKSFTAFERTIRIIENRNNSEYNNSTANTKVLQFAKKTHKDSVFYHLAQAMNKKSSKKYRAETIYFADRFLKEEASAPLKETILSKQAYIWFLSGNHTNAVKLYTRLANESQPKSKAKYLTSAIRSQRILAKWPKATPWSNLKKERPQNRKKLLNLYKQLNQTNPKQVNWAYMGHIGQLYINLNQPLDAFAAWSNALKFNTKGPDAQKAAGAMLTYYKRTSQWQKLEKLARLARNKRMKPQHNSKAINSSQLLALSLIENGKNLVHAKKFPKAIKKLNEFVSKFRSPKRDEGMYYLSLAYKGNNNYKLAIETTVKFTEQYKRSKYYKNALLNGGNWSMPMAAEEMAMHFYRRYVDLYPYEAQSAKVRSSLIDLYLGRELYSDAKTMIKAQLSSKYITQSQKQAYAFQIINIENINGNSKSAEIEANKLIKATNNYNLKVEVLSMKARHYNEKQQYNKLKSIERSLMAMNSTEATQQAIGEVRFMIANSKTLSILDPINSLTAKNPLLSIEKRYRQFKQIKSSYDRVCSAGETSYCVPAMQKVARISEELIGIFEDVEIAETLPKVTTDKFHNKKDQIISSLSQTIVSYDSKSQNLVEQGYTNPGWAQQVQFQNPGSMDFQRVGGEGGSTFIQWSVE